MGIDIVITSGCQYPHVTPSNVLMLKRGPISRIYGFKGLNTMKSLKMKMSVGCYVSVLYNSWLAIWFNFLFVRREAATFTLIGLDRTGCKYKKVLCREYTSVSDGKRGPRLRSISGYWVPCYTLRLETQSRWPLRIWPAERLSCIHMDCITGKWKQWLVIN